MLKYLITRIQELTKDNSNECGKYMLMLKILSSNRNLENIVQKMIKHFSISIESLKSFKK